MVMEDNNTNPLLAAYDAANNQHPLQKLYNDLTGKSQQRDEFSQQEYLLDIEQAFQREMLQLQMEYNGMPAQIKRMQDAGINISSLFGSANTPGTVGLASSPATPSVPSAVPMAGNFANTLMQALWQSVQSRIGNAQVDNLNAQTDQIKQDMFLRPLSTFAQIHVWRSEAKKYASEAGLNEEQERWINAQRLHFLDIKNLNKQELETTINNLIAQGDNIRQELKNLKASERNINASTNLVAEQELTQQAITDQERDKAQISEYRRRAAARIAGEFGALPIDGDDRTWLASMLMSDDPLEVKTAEKLLRGLGRVATEANQRETEARWQSYGKNFLMDLGDGVSGAIPNLPFMMMRKSSRTAKGQQYWQNATFGQ